MVGTHLVFGLHSNYILTAAEWWYIPGDLDGNICIKRPDTSRNYSQWININLE